MKDTNKKRPPSARARSVGTVAAPKLRLIQGGKRPRLITCADGFCGTPRPPAVSNPAWARLSLADVLALDWEIPGLREKGRQT